MTAHPFSRRAETISSRLDWQPAPFDAGRWQIRAVESRVEEHLGRRSLYLKGGIATVAGARFANGALAVDVALPVERGFMGAVWRVQDAGNYEEFYLRPHQSGNPDATQYSPVFNGISGWQLYHGERYAVPAAFRRGEWTRLEILFSGAQAEIHVGDLGEPALFVDGLKRGAEPGGVGVSALNFAAAHFSNFSFAAADSLPPAGRVAGAEPAAAGVISSWRVSDAFRESALEGRDALAPRETAGRRWSRLETEASGLADLARVQGIEGRRNTVFARKLIVSPRAQTRRLDFGFSDRIRVYLNGRLLYYGDDSYRSRDYRFLGSIGYFDALYLPLTQGENELLMAVSEDLGGWGVQAKLADPAGLGFQD